MEFHIFNTNIWLHQHTQKLGNILKSNKVFDSNTSQLLNWQYGNFHCTVSQELPFFHKKNYGRCLTFLHLKIDKEYNKQIDT